MKHLFIVNPKAGGVDASPKISAMAQKAFENSTDTYEVYTTKGPMDAPGKIKAEAAANDRIWVYACGGDGTINECVNGVALLPNAAICPMPLGTGNDFCRLFGDEVNLYSDMDAILNGHEHPIDLINANGRWCIGITSVGIDARIGTSNHKYSGIPLIGRKYSFIISTIVNVFKGINRNMVIDSGDFHDEGPHALVCACNGRYYGGGFNPTKTARLDDGDMDIIVVKGVNLPQLVLAIGKYSKGRAAELPQYMTILHGTEVNIHFDEENVVNIDGEALYAKDVNMKLYPAATKIVVPRGMKFFD